MKELPKKIWLQVEEDDEGEVTWCQDRINTSDVEYIKLSELPTKEEIQTAANEYSKGTMRELQRFDAFIDGVNWITNLLKGRDEEIRTL